MTLNYQDVVTADLSSLTDVAGAWKRMGERFGELKDDYAQHVQGVLANGNWQGEAFGAQQNGAAAIAFEFGAAKTEALAVAALLTAAQTELTRLQKAVKELVADAEKKEYKVDSTGRATYVGYDNLSPQERYVFQHDPDHTRLLADAREKARGWTAAIAKAVGAVDDADQSVKRALTRATRDVSMDGIGIGGFNTAAESDLAKAGRPEPEPRKKGGWVAETGSEASGPGLGTDASGPDVAKGKLAEAEASADLGSAKAEATLTNGSTELAGEAEAYAGAKVSAAAGITNGGAQAEAKGFAGGEASVGGTAATGPVGGYGRAETMAGVEAGLNAQAGAEGVAVGAEAFAGAKASAGAGADVAGIGVGATAEGWAGPGAEAGFNASRDANGVWHFGPRVGVSPGLGGSVGFEFTVDPGKFVDTVGDAAGWVGKGIGSLF
ncbi:hypothetical protein ACIOD0_01660 [Kitasatospora albolonga]|uniref:WXG100 family type VII secretion target n=1 Tax=Streptomyces stephensoniae TaxID=3375367 RepID=A0ABU2W3X9_9ACTN|nr:hypothetical protein [Streptomyces griseus]MDT0491832.1 hypothetical protein [Streptomyces griseus]